MRRPHDIFFKSVFQDPKRTTALLRAAAKKNPSLQEFINAVAEALRFSTGTWLHRVSPKDIVSRCIASLLTYKCQSKSLFG